MSRVRVLREGRLSYLHQWIHLRHSATAALAALRLTSSRGAYLGVSR
jgi:hypothetical protein